MDEQVWLSVSDAIHPWSMLQHEPMCFLFVAQLWSSWAPMLSRILDGAHFCGCGYSADIFKRAWDMSCNFLKVQETMRDDGRGYMKFKDGLSGSFLQPALTAGAGGGGGPGSDGHTPHEAPSGGARRRPGRAASNRSARRQRSWRGRRRLRAWPPAARRRA